jgi:hypothetical protein
MKGDVLLLLFILIYSPLLDGSKTSLAPAAIKSIIDQYFANNVQEIALVNFGRKRGDGQRTVKKLLKRENQSVAIRISQDVRKNFELEKLQLNSSSVLLFDSPQNFEKSFKSVNLIVNTQSVPRQLVYVAGMGVKELERFRNNKFSHHMDFLVNETPDSIDLATNFKQTPEACNTDNWKVINRFTREEKRWTNSSFFMAKDKNYHKCNFSVFHHYTKSAFGELYSIFANYLNFTIDMLRPGNTSYDLGMSTMTSFFRNFHFVHILHIETLRIYIPPGEVYNDYAKMLLPFDAATWIGVVLIIVVSSLAILLIKKFKSANQEIFLGRNNRSPFMNFVAVLLNGGQHITLMENVPRMFLLTFIFWSLIFR